MKSWTVGKKLYTGIGALVIVVVVLAGAGVWGSSTIKDQLDETGNVTALRIRLSLQVEREFLELFTAEKIMILAGYDDDRALHDSWRDTFDALVPVTDADLAELTSLMRIESGRLACEKMATLFEDWKGLHVRVASLVEEGQFHEAQMLSLNEGRPIIEEIRASAGVVASNQQDFLAEDMGRADEAYGQINMATWGLAALALFVGVISMWVIVKINRGLRTTASELRSSSGQVASAAGQVASSSQSLSQGATEQASSLEQSSASMEEMASMTRKNSENAQQAAELMTEAESRVGESNQALTSMVDAMSSIRASSEKVTKIIKTIDEIAFQTNILALNAAVEAARAAEAGMGFAVVADEVRNLAQRSAQAAKDTAGLIEESSANAQEGANRTEQVSTSITTITETVNKVKGLVDEVSMASKQQSQGIDQVTQAISQMERVTQTTAATAEESAAASEELTAQADAALGAVGQLETMVGTAAAATDSSAHGATRPSRFANVIKLKRPVEATAAEAPAPEAPLVEDAAEAEIPLQSTGTFGKF
ncbi:MAG: methyl-accepting chemotaxis protein [Vicinamibacterales bacterium]|jgi:methyl-accepting chemotaxis protein/methyl-accepting chemotaxis protein-1 (serine sensor receptor)|nr:methyl-accepting chemotaxis protein [Vicinamibacterales bacterium]